MNVVLMSFCSNDADDDGSGVNGGFSRIWGFPENTWILTKFRRKRVYICLTYPFFEDFPDFWGFCGF